MLASLIKPRGGPASQGAGREGSQGKEAPLRKLEDGFEFIAVVSLESFLVG